MTEGLKYRGRVILRGVVGSRAHGLAIEGTDDLDEMAVVLESPEAVLGLQNFETQIVRTAELRDGKNAASQAGDTDLVVYGLRHFCRLALKGNPSVLLLFFLPRYDVLEPAGRRLCGMSPSFASRRAGDAFLGYLRAQRQRLAGERGQKRVTRPNLVEKYGYDTKYAMHALRLGMQGREYLKTGNITVPMAEKDRDLLLAVRQGQVEFNSVLGTLQRMEAELEALIPISPLPEEPRAADIDEYLVATYRQELM